jgi:hypothetical protein
MFSSSQLPNRLWGPPSLISNGTGALFQGLKRSGRPTTAEIKDAEAIPPLPLPLYSVVFN